jgi:hypothetical protein
MATARELKEITFQTAEAIIEESTSDLKMLGQAYSVYLQDPEDPEPDWPEDTTHTITGYDSGSRKLEAAGTSTMRYITNANSLGMSMRNGSAGLATYYYEAQADSTIASANVSDRHVQGVYVEAPRLD